MLRLDKNTLYMVIKSHFLFIVYLLQPNLPWLAEACQGFHIFPSASLTDAKYPRGGFYMQSKQSMKQCTIFHFWHVFTLGCKDDVSMDLITKPFVIRLGTPPPSYVISTHVTASYDRSWKQLPNSRNMSYWRQVLLTRVLHRVVFHKASYSISGRWDKL